ncbi:MAG: hypothetical protein APF76_17245 [Desulfitibacter sp. BRH_c19]|nr:MAG: hypothetical protein APF76_17245 [Desulfitibacter sp. BRH_c19]
MPIIYREDIRKKILNDLSTLNLKSSHSVYFNKLDESSAKIQGNTIRSIFHPYVLTNEEYVWIKNKSERLWNILEKTARLLVTDKKVAEFFDFPKELLGLLRITPGYDTNIPITRFDAFYNPKGSIYFCEFNTDGTSGMNETNTMEECFLSTKVGRELRETYSLEQFELRRSLLATLVESYESFNGTKMPTKKPNIAIVDFMDKATIAEFEALRDVFIAEGYNTIIADPRDLTYHEDALWMEDFKIDLIYRRAVTTELLERFDAVQAFIEAYKNKAFCMVGSFRSEAAHSKLVFTFLTSSTAEEYFSKEEITFIRNHLPFTIRLTSSNKLLLNQVLKEKDNHIIKPHNSYGSQGLYMGKDYSTSQWQQLISDNLDKNYIAQELIAIPTEDFLASPSKVESLKVNLSPFLYGGKLKGFYTRISNLEVITTSRGGALIPTFLAR